MSDAALRRILHAATAGMALFALLSPVALRVASGATAAAAFIFEMLRLRSPAAGRMLATLVPVYREAERRRPSGALWLAFGYALASWLPVPASAAGLLAGGLADPAGAAVGTRFGRGAPKSAAGSLAVATVAAMAGVATGLPLRAALAAGVVAALLERWPGPFDDNLVVAPGTAFAAALLA